MKNHIGIPKKKKKAFYNQTVDFIYNFKKI